MPCSSTDLSSMNCFADDAPMKDECMEWPLFPTQDHLSKIPLFDADYDDVVGHVPLDLTLFSPVAPVPPLSAKQNDPSAHQFHNSHPSRSISPTITTSDVSNSSLSAAAHVQCDDSSPLLPYKNNNNAHNHKQNHHASEICSSVSTMPSHSQISPSPSFSSSKQQQHSPSPMSISPQPQLSPSPATASTSPTSSSKTTSPKKRGKATVAPASKQKAESDLIQLNIGNLKSFGAVKKPTISSITKDGLDAKKKAPVKSHTRKCREKVSLQLEILSQVLPRPENASDVKHKGQLIEYTIQTVQQLLKRRTKLQAGITLSSIKSLQSWVRSMINSSLPATSNRQQNNNNNSHNSNNNNNNCNSSNNNPSSNNCKNNSNDEANDSRGNSDDDALLFSILESFLKLYCSYTNWSYCELWMVDKSAGKDLQLELKSTLINVDDTDSAHYLNLKEFSNGSASETNVNDQHNNILFRVLNSCITEWVDEIGMKNNQFNRFHMTNEHGLKVLQVMPINSLHNQRTGVFVLGDVNNRKFNVSAMQSLREYVNVVLEEWVQQRG